MFRFDGLSRLSQLDVTNQRVFVRADLDCPFDRQGRLSDDGKIRAAAVTLRHLLSQQAQVVVGSHLTLTPGQRGSLDARFEQCAARLAEILRVEVFLPDEVLGPMARKLMNDLRADRVMLLPDLGSCPDEVSGNEAFARELCAAYDLYVGDCLDGPPNYATLSVMPRLSRDRALGIRAEQEVLAANRFLQSPRARSLLVVGGSFEQGEALLDWAVRTQRSVLAVGDIGVTLLAAAGQSVGATSVPTSLLPRARTWLDQAHAAGISVTLPDDVYVEAAPAPQAAIDVKSLSSKQRVVDTGPSAREQLVALLRRHEGVLMVGSWSSSREPARELAAALAALRDSRAFSLIIQDSELRVDDTFEPEAGSDPRFISTSSLALLNLIQGKRLAVLENLRTPD